jgi:hypothetical protein
LARCHSRTPREEALGTFRFIVALRRSSCSTCVKRSLHRCIAARAPPSRTESIESAQELSSMVPRGHSCISGWSTMCLPLSLSRLWFFPACLSALRESHISMLPNARMQSKPLFFSLVRRMIATLINRVAEKASAHSGSVLSVAFSPDGTKIVSGSEDGTIKAWSSGAPRAQNRPSLAETDACWLVHQARWGC